MSLIFGPDHVETRLTSLYGEQMSRIFQCPLVGVGLQRCATAPRPGAQGKFCQIGANPVLIAGCVWVRRRANQQRPRSKRLHQVQLLTQPRQRLIAGHCLQPRSGPA